ncbi:MAG: hypothetical protein GX776_08400 [Oxalobacter sp.]|nr:hypothetical protein [Oxalobacter sp.]
MKKKLRKIMVRNHQFLWRYTQDNANLSTLLVQREGKPVWRWRIRFHTQDTWTGGNPLNEGIAVTREGEAIELNLNRPGHVGEIIQYLL